MEALNICYLSYEYPLWGTGGIGSFIQTIARALVRAGHRVSVVGIGKGPQEEHFQDRGVDIYRLPAPRFFKKASFAENAWRIRRKLREMHESRPLDVVEAPEALMFMLPAKTPYVKVVRMHGGHHFFAESEQRPIDAWKGFLERRSYARADAFVAVSEYVKRHTAKYLSTEGRPLATIRYPIDGDLFRQADLDLAQKHRLVFAGTVCEKKGIRQLIQALELIIPRFPEVQLDVYGRDWFFPDKRSYTAWLKEQFSEEILQHLHFHGPLPLSEIPARYEQAELCVFPSHMETQGLVAPEAMFMGKAVLFTRAGPGPETIRHKENGLLCNPYEPLDIAEQIIYAFEHPERMKELALQGQQDARAMFGLEGLVAKNTEFYRSLK